MRSRGWLIETLPFLRSSPPFFFFFFLAHSRRRVYSAQGVTVVAAVAGTLLLTNKAEQQKDARTRALTGQVPVDPEEGSVPVTRVADVSVPDAAAAAPATAGTSSATRRNTAGSSSSSSALPPAAPAVTSHEGSSSGSGASGRYARPSRVSQALAETDRLLDDEGRATGGRIRPMKVSEFQKRLGRAEQLQKEEDELARK